MADMGFAQTLLQKRILISGAILLSYITLAILLTFPLVLHFGTHTPFLHLGADNQYYLWAFWWVKTALIDHTHSLWETNYLFYPDGVDLRAGYDGVFSILISLPLQLATKNLVLTYNLILIGSLAGSAFTAYLLLHHLVRNRPAAFLGGIIYGFSSALLTRVLFGHVNYLTAEWIPLFVLAFFILIRRGRLKWILGTAIALLLVALSSWFYLAAMAFFILLTTLWLAWQSPHALGRRVLIRMSLSLILSVIIILPFLWPFLAALWEGNFQKVPLISPIIFSLDLLSPLIPPPWNTIGNSLQDIIFRMTPDEELSRGKVGYFGVVELALLLVALFSYRNRRKEQEAGERTNLLFWFVILSMFLVLAFGPVLRGAGFLTMIPLPSLGLRFLPGFSLFSSPQPFLLYSFLALAVLSAYVLARPFTEHHIAVRRKLGLFLAVFVLLIVERLAFPFPIQKLDLPQFYERIRDEQGDYALLNVPTFGLFGDYNYAQTVHGKKIVGGYVNHLAQRPEIFRFVVEHPFLRFASCHGPPGPTPEVTRGELEHLLLAHNIQYIVLHPSTLARCEPVVQRFVLDFFKSVPTTFRDERITVYRAVDLSPI